MLLTTSMTQMEHRDVDIVIAAAVGYGDSEQAAINNATDNFEKTVGDSMFDQSELLHRIALRFDVTGIVKRGDSITIDIGNGTWCCITSYRLIVHMQRTSVREPICFVEV